jgi:hypothetical protein
MQASTWPKSLIKLIVAAFLVSLPAVPASARTLYSAYNGKGIDCTREKPCFLAQTLKLAKSGDIIVMKDGTERGKYRTNAPGVTIQAENEHKAVIDGSGSSTHTFEIRHSNTILRGVSFVGNKKGRMVFVGPPGTAPIANIIVERNKIVGSSAAGIQVGSWGKTGAITNVTIRHNYIEDVGSFQDPGEGIYVGAAPDKKDRKPVKNVKIYGNTVVFFSQNAIDLKELTENVDIHHNHFIRQVKKPHHKKPGNEGTIAVDGSNHLIHSNVMENLDPTFGAFYVTPGRGHVIFGNIINGTKSGDAYKLKEGGKGNKGKPTIIRDNVWCDMNSKVAPKHPGIQQESNLGLEKASMTHEVCDEKAVKILEEMATIQ